MATYTSEETEISRVLEVIPGGAVVVVGLVVLRKANWNIFHCWKLALLRNTVHSLLLANDVRSLGAAQNAGVVLWRWLAVIKHVFIRDWSSHGDWDCTSGLDAASGGDAAGGSDASGGDCRRRFLSGDGRNESDQQHDSAGEEDALEASHMVGVCESVGDSRMCVLLVVLIGWWLVWSGVFWERVCRKREGLSRRGEGKSGRSCLVGRSHVAK